MSQHDYLIDNQDGGSFRADLNNVLAAILSGNSGPTAPTVTQPFMPWFDTTAGVLKIRNQANTAWQAAVTPDLFAAKQVGDVVQVVNTQVGTSTTTTNPIPMDDTVPQNTEGAEFMTVAITPRATTNRLRIDVVVQGSHSVTGDFVLAALFKDSDASALAAMVERNDSAGGKCITFTHFMTAGTLSAITFRVRAGGFAAGTFTFNGTGGARRMGGVMASSITVTEIKA